MKAFAFILLTFFTKTVFSAETLTTVYTGTDYVDQFDIYGDSVAFIKNISTFVYKSGSLDTKLTNITELRCSTSKRSCIVGVDFVYTNFTVDPSSGSITPGMIYSVRPQTKYRIHSRVAFIEGTEYFLTASLSKYGINRWRIGKNDSFSQLKIQSLGNSLEVVDLLIVDRTNYALLSFASAVSITLIDFVAMTEVRSIKGAAGHLALLSADPSQANFLSATENKITKYSYLDGSTVATMACDYIVSGMKNVNQTDFVIVATWEQVFVYSFTGNDPKVWAASPYYYYTSGKQMPGGVRFDQSTATMYFAGLSHVTGLADTTAAYCHPNCQTCSAMLSEYKCSSCKSPAVMDNGVCKVSAESIKAPPGGSVSLATASWSDDNMKPAAPKGFDIKDYYLYFIIGGGGLIGIICVFCICRMCCKKSEEEQNAEKQSRVRHQQNYQVKNVY